MCSGIPGGLQDLQVLLRDSGLLLGLLLGLDPRHPLLVEGQGLDPALVLQARDQVLVLPAKLLGQIAQLAEAPLWLQAEHLQARWDDHALLEVVRVRGALEALEAVKCTGPALSLVRNHAADGAPEDLGGRAEVEWSLPGVGVHLLALEVRILQLVAVERTGDVDVLSADARDMLAVQQLLCERGCKPTQQVAAAVNDNLLPEGHGGWALHFSPDL
mmetsp:Transcript_173191/g.421274  ORF Transcript_173191/g.421274 Transcript_173191/m.421274 type:complete len:216 (+) Transcript_173191:80-727(+)